MPTQCVVNGCKSKYGKNNPKGAVLMHRFPNQPETKNLWVEFVSVQNNHPYNHRRDHRLCSLHFAPDSYIDGDLKWKSVPTEFFERYETSEDGWCDKPEIVFKDELVITACDGDPSSSPPAVSTSLEEMVDDPLAFSKQEFSIIAATDASEASQSSSQPFYPFYSPSEVSLRLKETGRKRTIEDFSVEDFDTPQKCARNLEKLKEMARDKNQKLKCSRTQVVRWKKKASSLKSVMQELRDQKRISEDVQKVIEGVKPSVPLSPLIATLKDHLKRCRNENGKKKKHCELRVGKRSSKSLEDAPCTSPQLQSKLCERKPLSPRTKETVKRLIARGKIMRDGPIPINQELKNAIWNLHQFNTMEKRLGTWAISPNFVVQRTAAQLQLSAKTVTQYIKLENRGNLSES